MKRMVVENETSQEIERHVYVTRACAIKSTPNVCERLKFMVAPIKDSELICGHCESDGCNFGN